MSKQREIIRKYSYETRAVQRGYANRTLYINLSSSEIKERPVTQKMKDVFTGGRGFCLWLLWNAVTGKTQWSDPENELVLASGPIGGIIQYPGSGKTTVVTLSPLTHNVYDSNGGGYFGPYLKFSGWDALEIQGKASEDVILFIDGDTGTVQIESAGDLPTDTHILSELLTGQYAGSKEGMRNISVVSAGQGAEHSLLGGLNLSFYDNKRGEIRYKQAARGGVGRVFRDKKIKAIVVKYSHLSATSNGPAKPDLIRDAGRRINKEILELDNKQNNMRTLGTTNLVEIINHTDLLPTENFRYGSDPQARKISAEYWRDAFDHTSQDSCWYGCSMACAHKVNDFVLKSGPYKGQKVLVDGPEYETIGGMGSNIGVFDPEALLEFNFYCDTYGLDTISMGSSIAFAMECYEVGILDQQVTGGLDLTWGNSEAVLEILHQIARGSGFGMLIGQGIREMKKIFAEQLHTDPQFLQDIGMEIKGLEISEYMPKESLAQQGGFALANKGPQHDEAWLIFMDMVKNQIPTFEDKAEALHFFPVFRTWFSLHGLCKLPWNDIVPEDNYLEKEPAKVPSHIRNYLALYEGVTGTPITQEELLLQSERVYNFQRIFNLRMGTGTRAHDYPPYRAVGPVTEKEYLSRVERYDRDLREKVGVDPNTLTLEEKILTLRRYRMNQYEQLVDAVYKRRGWDQDGVPTLETARRLGIDFPDVVGLIKAHGE
ncbi:MAG: aldehyde:ferredoxin oxidoreductase [Chloroflexi bacterium]|nr:aldehyde:ferredoxin oxidoreductase [Chloroflexota bacterium]